MDWLGESPRGIFKEKDSWVSFALLFCGRWWSCFSLGLYWFRAFCSLGLWLLSRVPPSEMFLKSISKEITGVEVIYPSRLALYICLEEVLFVSSLIFNFYAVVFYIVQFFDIFLIFQREKGAEGSVVCEVRDEVVFVFYPRPFMMTLSLVFFLNIAVILVWHNPFALLYFIFVTVACCCLVLSNNLQLKIMWRGQFSRSTHIVFQACITIAIIKYLQFERSTCSSETKTYCFEVIFAPSFVLLLVI